MCDEESPDESINEVRQTLFTQKGSDIENIPPTRDALHQHAPRVGFQAVLVMSEVRPSARHHNYLAQVNLLESGRILLNGNKIG